MKSVGWSMADVAFFCPGSGVAVNVTAPAVGVTAPSSRALIPTRGSLNVTATRTPSR